MWATPNGTTRYLRSRYQAACAHADATIAALDLDATATVPWWKEAKRNTTLGVLLTHMIAESSQHLGPADIVGERIDGTTRSDTTEMGDAEWWHAFHDSDASRQWCYCGSMKV